jgi:hypothetical protein
MRAVCSLLFVVWICLFTGCRGAPDPGPPDSGVVCEVTAPTTCPDPAPRFQDVQAIFQARCQPCHNGTPNGPWPLITYEHVADWQDTVRSYVLDCSMPPPDAGFYMATEERLQILAWVRCGAPR